MAMDTDLRQRHWRLRPWHLPRHKQAAIVGSKVLGAVHHQEAQPVQIEALHALNASGQRTIARPVTVAEHCGERRNRLQLIKDGLGADIAGM